MRSSYWVCRVSQWHGIPAAPQLVCCIGAHKLRRNAICGTGSISLRQWVDVWMNELLPKHLSSSKCVLCHRCVRAETQWRLIELLSPWTKEPKEQLPITRSVTNTTLQRWCCSQFRSDVPRAIPLVRKICWQNVNRCCCTKKQEIGFCTQLFVWAR